MVTDPFLIGGMFGSPASGKMMIMMIMMIMTIMIVGMIAILLLVLALWSWPLGLGPFL